MPFCCKRYLVLGTGAYARTYTYVRKYYGEYNRTYIKPLLLFFLRAKKKISLYVLQY